MGTSELGVPIGKEGKSRGRQGQEEEEADWGQQLHSSLLLFEGVTATTEKGNSADAKLKLNFPKDIQGGFTKHRSADSPRASPAWKIQVMPSRDTRKGCSEGTVP